MKVMGIDVGFNGGIAIIDTKENCTSLLQMPTVKSENGNELDYSILFGLISNVDIVYIEKQQPRPVNGVKQAFKHGGQYYSLRAICKLLQVRVTYVSKQTWAKVMLMDMNKSDKSNSVVRACQLFPELEDIIKKTKKDADGKAEALLIAEYGVKNESRKI